MSKLPKKLVDIMEAIPAKEPVSPEERKKWKEIDNKITDAAGEFDLAMTKFLNAINMAFPSNDMPREDWDKLRRIDKKFRVSMMNEFRMWVGFLHELAKKRTK